MFQQGGAVAESTSRAAQVDPGTTHSLEECRRLILHWAKELAQVDRVSGAGGASWGVLEGPRQAKLRKVSQNVP